MATLLNAVTTDGAGTPEESLSGPCSVQVFGTFAGATIHVEASYDGTNWSAVGLPGQLRQPGWVFVNAQGTYDLRAVVSGASATTSVSATSGQ